MKLLEAFNEYIEESCVPRGNSERTIKAVRARAVIVAKRFGNPEIEDIKFEDVVKFRNEMAGELRQTTQSIYLCFIRATLRWQALKGRNVLNYQLVVMPRCAPRDKRPLLPEEVSRMEDAATCIRDRLLISLLYTSGIRISELLSLNRDSIVNGEFYVIGKGNKGRVCFTDDKTMALLKLYLKQRKDSSPHLFVSSRGNLVSPQLVDCMLKRTARRAGITKRVSAHIFRHSFATNLIDNEVDTIYVQRLLGHKMISTTSVYAHPNYEQMRRTYFNRMAQTAWQKHHSSGIIRR